MFVMRKKINNNNKKRMFTLYCIVPLVPDGFTVLFEANLFNCVIGVQVAEYSDWITDKNVQFRTNFSQTLVQIFKTFEQETKEMKRFWSRSCTTLT